MTGEIFDDRRSFAVAMLRASIPDRPREFWVGDTGVMLLDDSGGSPIEVFDDITACHYFLVWLDARRTERESQFKVQSRRAAIALVKGGA